MQFKIVRHRDRNGIYRQGDTVQCLRRVREVSVKYPEGKNVQRVVAKIDRWAKELSPNVATILTAKEQLEWQTWRNKHVAIQWKDISEFELNALPDHLSTAAQLIEGGHVELSSAEANAIWNGVRALISSLEHKGHHRPKRPRGRPSKTVIAIEDDFVLNLDPPLPNFAPPGSDAYRSYQRLLDNYFAQKKVRK